MRLRLNAPFWNADGGASGGGAAAGDGGQTATKQEGSLKTDGGQGGNSGGESGKTYSQADLDRAISQAIKTREENLRKEQEEAARKAEQEKLIAEQKYKELFERQKAEADRLRLSTETAKELASRGLGHFGDLFEADLSTMDGRKKAIEIIDKTLKDELERRINEKLKTGTGAKGSPDPGGGSISYEAAGQMTPEEYMKARAAGKIR
jgi:hypothetical protein